MYGKTLAEGTTEWAFWWRQPCPSKGFVLRKSHKIVDCLPPQFWWVFKHTCATDYYEQVGLLLGQWAARVFWIRTGAFYRNAEKVQWDRCFFFPPRPFITQIIIVIWDSNTLTRPVNCWIEEKGECAYGAFLIPIFFRENSRPVKKGRCLERAAEGFRPWNGILKLGICGEWGTRQSSK